MKKHFTQFSLALAAMLLGTNVAEAQSAVGFAPVNDTECRVLKYNASEGKYWGDIVIPETWTNNGKTYNVVEIVEEAFYDCKGLTSITLPATMRTIGKSAFAYCSNLASIDLGGTQIVSNYAFDNVYGTSKLVIPATVDSIGYNAFAHMTGLQHLEFEDGDKPIRYDGWERYNIYTDSLRTLYCGRPLTNTRFRPSYAKKLHTITFGEAVTSIPDDFATNDTCLVKINFAGTEKRIGKAAFYGCTHLPEVNFPASLDTIHAQAFQYCTDLADIKLNTGVKAVGDYAFESVRAAKSLSIPANIDSIGYNAFWYMTGLQDLRFEDGDKPIRYNSWERYNFCTDSLRTLYCGRPMPNTRFRPQYAYKLHTITFGKAVTSIPDDFATKDTCLTKINFAGTEKRIGKAAFYSCWHLPKVSFPASLDTIHAQAFQYCTDLASIKFNTGVKAVGDNAFASVRAAKSLTIPANIDSIGYNAFWDMTGLQHLEFEDGDKPIRYDGWERYNFCTDSLRTLYCGRPLNNTRFRPQYAYKLHTITFGKAVTSVPDDFATKDTCLVKINFAGTEKRIGKAAFYSCWHLPEVNIPASLDTIHAQAFQYCTDLADIKFNTGVKAVGDHAFASVRAAKSLSIPANIDSIGYNAFWDMTGLQNLRFEDGDKPIRYDGWERYNIYTDSLRTLYCGRPMADERFRPEYSRKLWKVTFGQYVDEIPSNFTTGTKSITAIECLGSVPPKCYMKSFLNEDWSGGYKIYENATLYVNEDDLLTYQSANFWSLFYGRTQIYDAIDAPEASAGDARRATMYNLQGVPVSDSYKGIVIVGGKKVLKK